MRYCAMKLKKLMLAALFASVFLWCTAAANNVSDINIDVTVKNDGSAVIVQHWTGILMKERKITYP